MDNFNQIPITKPSFQPRNLNPQQDSKPSTSTSISFNQIAPTHDTGSDTNRTIEFLRSLPPGYRFMPTNLELIRDYLRPKIANEQLPPCLIHSVDLYRSHPKSLAERYLRHPDVEEVYFFSPRDRKYKNGQCPNRVLEGIGFWKATGADKPILGLRGEVIGFMKSLVFYEGTPTKRDKTNWIMHEFRVCGSRKRTSNNDMKLDDWILCRIHERKVKAPPKKKDGKEDANANTNTNTNISGTENADNIDYNDDVNNLLADAEVVVTDGDEGNNGEDVANDLISVNYCTYNGASDPLDDIQLGSWLPSVPFLWDPCLENFNVNDNYTPGSFPSYDDPTMSCVPGPSYADEYLWGTDNVLDEDGHWGTCNNGFDYGSTSYANFGGNFQGSSSGLNMINNGSDGNPRKLYKK